ncbi:hypothetical protein SETIT_9G250500v2 [Setaria italica]|uniref:Uncharacterized protein n=1 Tax=Setaria italica TaxID=4555 RepID=A0A368SKG2_SETIT|nr:hypothetical protein SETIT_9G250500v2 [Setaria italica]
MHENVDSSMLMMITEMRSSGDCGHQNHDNDGHVVLQDNKNAGRSSRPWCQCGVEAFWLRSSLFPVENRVSGNTLSILFID